MSSANSARVLSMETKECSVQELMDEIRSTIKADYERLKDSQPRFQARPVDPHAPAQFKAGELLGSEELRYLNQNFAYANAARGSVDLLSSHRGGFLGKIIVKFKRKIGALLWDSVFKEYFEREKEYTANLVRFLNTTAKYADARDAANFWELIRKIDVDITRVLERVERLHDEQSGAALSVRRDLLGALDVLKREVQALSGQLGAHRQTLDVLESVTRGLEGIVARASKPLAVADKTQDAVEFINDERYLLLENRYRGSEELIDDRVSIYPPFFAEQKFPILEIGGGRGELQALFKKSNVPSYSIDIDGAMVAAAQEKGIDARHGDGIAHLATLEDGSLGGVIAIQVVEHLSREALEHLFALCRRKVAQGGRIVFETINPKSVMALSSNYFRDPTHVWPLHPDTLSYMMTLAGLHIVEVKYLSPVPRLAGLPAIEPTVALTPRWEELVDAINGNFERLHNLLFGHQDYCVIAEVR